MGCGLPAVIIQCYIDVFIMKTKFLFWQCFSQRGISVQCLKSLHWIDRYNCIFLSPCRLCLDKVFHVTFLSKSVTQEDRC